MYPAIRYLPTFSVCNRKLKHEPLCWTPRLKGYKKGLYNSTFFTQTYYLLLSYIALIYINCHTLLFQ